MLIEIDDKSGFCFGVVKAISTAEKSLAELGKVYSLGDIVHNRIEVQRLERLGLQTISHAQFPSLEGQTVLIRAHGEPPSTYRLAKEHGIRLIDATCPVVSHLHGLVKKAHEQMARCNGQVVILGKRGHAEVVGLTGEVNEDAIVVETIDDLEHIDFTRPIYLLSQTTQSLALFEQITHEHWEKLYALIEAAMLNYPYAHAEDIDLLCLTGGHSQWYLVENLFNGRGIGTLGRAGEENNHVCFSKLIRENWRISSIKEPYPQISVAQGMCHIGNHITFNHRSANNVWIQFAINDKESAREKVMDFSQELPYNTDLEMKLGTISQQYTKETNDDYRGYIKVYTGTTPDEDNFEIIPLSFTTGFLAAILNVKYDVQAQIKLTVEDNNIIRVNGHLILTPQTSHIWRKIINTKDIAFEKSNRTDTGEQTI